MFWNTGQFFRSSKKGFFILLALCGILFLILSNRYSIQGNYRQKGIKTRDLEIGSKTLTRLAKASVTQSEESTKETVPQKTPTILKPPLNNRDVMDITPHTIMKYPYSLNYTRESKNPCFYVEKDSSNISSSVEFRCVPYYMLIGMPKCGTTYMAAFLHQHPQILDQAAKEIHYWCMAFKKNMDYYSGRFSQNAATIRDYIEHRPGSQCPFVFGDHTPSTGFFMRYYEQGLDSPDGDVTPFRIQKLNPNTKYIMLVREPVKRTLSSFIYFWTKSYRKVRSAINAGTKTINYVTAAVDMTSQGFHSYCAEFIQWWRDCIHIHTERICALGFKGIEQTYPQSWKDSGSPTTFLRFRNSLYILFLEEWLSAIPRKNLLVVKFENFTLDEVSYANNHIYPHLGVEPFGGPDESNKTMGTNENNWIGDQVQLLPETRQMLHDFFEPYNRRLAILLDDEQFLWRGS